MKKNLTISISKAPKENSLVSLKPCPIREKLLRLLLGIKVQSAIILIGADVQEIEIRKAEETESRTEVSERPDPLTGT